MHVVAAAEMRDLPLRAKVVCELQEGRYGGSTVTLHSGVQVGGGQLGCIGCAHGWPLCRGQHMP